MRGMPLEMWARRGGEGWGLGVWDWGVGGEEQRRYIHFIVICVCLMSVIA